LIIGEARDSSIQDKAMHALLTGASSGIGESLAIELANAGYDLTLVARRKEKLEQVAKKCESKVNCFVIPQDLSKLSGINDLVTKAIEENGPIDVLINNAGVQIVARTEEVSIEDAEWLLRIDVQAPFRLTHAVLPGMIARKSGTVVDIASLAALAPIPGMYYYNAAKAALAAASESLRAEMKRFDIHVLTVYPGPVKTPMADRALDQYKKDPMLGLPIGASDVLARRIVKGIKKKHSRLIYPRFYHLSRWFPGVTRWAIDTMSELPESKKEQEAAKS
jgi:short-subunit dehydrogenase